MWNELIEINSKKVAYRIITKLNIIFKSLDDESGLFCFEKMEE